MVDASTIYRNSICIFLFISIYRNNGFENLGESVENDLELRSIYYSEEQHTLFVLDKFEFMYSIVYVLINILKLLNMRRTHSIF